MRAVPFAFALSAFVLAALALAANAVRAQAPPERIEGLAAVIDGDSLVIEGREIRLFGIDAPESRQSCGPAAGAETEWACGQAASDALAALVAGRRTACWPRDIDRYGRTIAACRAGGRDLAAEMVRQGLALAYRRFSTRYVAEEDAARAARRGLWSGPFMAPADWRKAHPRSP